MFPDLSNNFTEYDVTVADRNGGQNYKNKTQVVINENYP